MSNNDLLKRTDDDGVTILTLNTPKSINALSEAMLAALSNAGNPAAAVLPVAAGLISVKEQIRERR